MVLHRIAVVSAFAVSATAVLAQTVSPQQGREIPAYTRCRCLRTSAPRCARL
jgi:hypothetical protein